MKRRKGLAFILALSLVLSSFSVAFATDVAEETTPVTETTTEAVAPVATATNTAFADIAGHWAKDAIVKWADYGVVKGSDGVFRPDAPLTRAEMATVLSNLMDYKVAAKNNFSDVATGAWYADAVLKANAAGVLSGDGSGLASPSANITREQATSMLARAFAVADANGTSSSLTDTQNISSWARPAVFGMEAAGYVRGFEGKFNPKNNITRAEVITIINSAVKAYYTAAGTYTENVDGLAVVKVPGVVLKDVVISGNLIAAEGIASGDLTLDGKTEVKGKLIVRGGGENSIIIKGSAAVLSIEVSKVDGKVRIFADGALIKEITALKGEIILEGNFTNVEVKADATVIIKGNVGTLSMESKGTVDIQSGTVTTLDIPAGATATVAANATVTTANITGAADIKGTGAIGTANISGTGATIVQTPTAVNVADGGAATVGGKTVDGATSAAPSTGGGRGNSSNTVAVSAININKSTTTLVEGTTETLTATFTPSNASNKTITWTTSDASKATIDSTGKVRAVSAGTATITAKSNNGKTATCVVTVTTTVVPVSAITVNPTTMDLTVGGASKTIVATVKPADATNKSVTWTSSNIAVATVTDGVVTPKTVGTTTITAKTVDGGFAKTILVTVTATPVTVTGVAIETAPTKVTYTEGEVLDLTGLVVTLTKSDSSTENVAFADFSSKGLTTSLADGTNLTVASHNGTKITITHTVSSESAETDALTVNAALSDSKAITSFKLETLSPAVTGVIDEGSKTIALTVAHDTDVTALVPTIGHTGASISPDTGAAQDFTSPVTFTVTAEDSSTADYVVTVTVAAESFTLTYIAGTGGTITGTSSQTVSSGGDGTPVKAIANEGYSFDKWSDGVTAAERTDKNVTANITVTAQFEINKYTVTFKDHDGTELETQTVEHGSGATAPADPTRTGYTFTGWDNTFTNVTGDLAVTAQYNINKYTITFDSDGGSTVASITQDYGTAITPPANPTKTGYTFANWNPSLPANMPANDLTVIAQYTKDALVLTAPTVTSDLQEGKTNVAVGAEIIASLTATGGDSSYTYSLEGTDAAKFAIDSSTGKVTVKDNPLTEGTYNITVKVTDGVSATAKQAVSVLVAGPDVVLGAPVTGLEAVLQMGATETATASTTEAGAGGWTSSDPSVATVDASTGVVTALKAGTTTIAYTTSTSGNVNSKEITVYASTFTSQTDNSISNDVATLGLVGNEVSSSSSSVATGAIESDKIKITSSAQGSTIIIVKSVENFEAKIAVTVAVDGTITIGAITKPALNVTYDINEGSGTVPTQAPLTSGDTFTVASPAGLTAPTGKQFKEWNTSHYGIGTGYAPGSTFTMGTSHVTLYAIWENIYTVTFVAGENGSLTDTTEFVDIINGTAWETAVTVPSPVANPGFKFKDWTPTFPATVTKNATYTANFVALSTDASLSGLTVDGTTITSFNPSTLIYNVELAIGTTTVPTVTATANDSKASAVVTNASSLPGETTILVTAEDGITTKTYTINFTVAADTTPPVITATDKIVPFASLAAWTGTVSATDDVDGNITSNIVATYFESDGTTSLTDLAAAKEYIGDASVNTSFIIKYNVSDAADNAATEVVVTITVTKANVPDSISVGGKTLNSTNPYLVDGKPATTGTLGVGNCTAHFDPLTGVLSLQNYVGGEIRINEAGKDLRIKLIGNANKITGGQFGIHNDKGDIYITSDNEALLEIERNSSSNGAAIANGWVAMIEKPSVFIGGKVKLTIKAEYTGEQTTDSITGIYAGRGSVIIQDQADYFATLTNSKYQGRGIYSNGTTIINTSGNIEIDVSNSVRGIGIYGNSGIEIQQVNSMLITIPSTGGTNTKFTSGTVNVSSGVAVNKSATKASYRSGTPYTLGLEGGNITSATGGVIGSTNHQYLVDDEITIQSTIAEFDRWTKADGTALETSLFTGSDTAESATATIKMLAGSLSIKAKQKDTRTIIDIAAIEGVIVPVTGATPVTTITETAQYTGTVTWSPIATKFAVDTAYTATITLVAESGFKLDGVTANFFKVAGATTTNTADSGVVTAVFPATAPDFALGSGTEVDPYQVSSAEELNKVRNHLEKHFIQTADINLSTYTADGGWQPIGDSTTPFKGTYDGDSKDITDLFINREADYQGLFGSTASATIKNCRISGSVTGKNYVGGLVGSNDGGTISSCYAPSVSITGKDSVGGLVGFVKSSSGALATIEKSYASGSVKGVINVGGLVGLHSMQGDNIGGSIKNSYTDVSVDATESYVGGLIGNNKADYRYGETSIENCYSKGSVKSSLEGEVFIGGLVGGSNHNIKNSYAVGKVIVTNGKDGFIGGLIGRVTGNAIVTSSYYDSTTTEQTDTGKGVGKTTEEMKQADTFVGWDFTNIWIIVEGSSYPTLK